MGERKTIQKYNFVFDGVANGVNLFYLKEDVLEVYECKKGKK